MSCSAFFSGCLRHFRFDVLTCDDAFHSFLATNPFLIESTSNFSLHCLLYTQAASSAGVTESEHTHVAFLSLEQGIYHG